MVKEIEADDEVWVAILTGEGGEAFCAGADLKEVSEGRMRHLFTPDGQFAGFVKHPRNKIWIAAIEGFAVAGGFEIALACDMIVASDTSVFALPEPARGIVAAAGGAYRLVRALPRAVAMELIVTGDRLTARRAAELGLVNHVTAFGNAVARATELASRICTNAPLAVRESAALARRAFDGDDDALFDASIEALERIMRTEDYQEGPLAFVQKRTPVWRGC